MTRKINSENFETTKKESLKGEYSVYKPDPILLMRDNMQLTQMRFFEAYLSKIDASDPSTYRVRIPLDTVAQLANIDLSNRLAVKKMCEDIENTRFDFKRYRERYAPEQIDPNIKVHRDTFPLFDRFMLNSTLDGKYFIEVIPGVTMAKMLQKYQSNYATYELQEVYALSNKTNMRMYSCFKRFQSFGTTKISIELLKGYLGIDEHKYRRTTDFRKFVLEPGIEEINEVTDITVTHKPYKKGKNIVGWVFVIKPRTKVEEKKAKVEFAEEPNVETMGIYETTFEQKELTIAERNRLALIEIAREVMMGKYEYTDTELEFVVVAVENSSWWKAQQKFIQEEYPAGLAQVDAREKLFRSHLEFQYKYCQIYSRSKTQKGFLSFLTKVLSEVKAQPDEEPDPKENNSSFDVNEFFDAAINRSYKNAL